MNERDETKSFSLPLEIPVDFCPIVVGKIYTAYGILGWLKIISYTEPFDSIMNYQPWYVQLSSQWRCLHLDHWKQYQDSSRFIVKMKDIGNRDIAKSFSNYEIFVDVFQFPPLSDGEYYWKDMLGCQVISISGYLFGVVVDLIQTGSNDVLVINNKMCNVIFNQCYLIPFISKVIQDVDFLNHIITVNWNPKF